MVAKKVDKKGEQMAEMTVAMMGDQMVVVTVDYSADRKAECLA